MSTTKYSSGNDLDKSSQLKKHKLPASFSESRVTHEWDGERDVWVEKGRIAAGAHGLILLQENEATKELRAVKKLWKEGLAVVGRTVQRELTHLISVMDRPDLFVKFSGWYENKDAVYYVMEYHNHGDLDRYIKHGRDQARREAREISKQLLKGLVELHKRQICHRDLKPQNILIASLSPIHIKLADFGISKSQEISQMNTSGVGTFGYIAPELLYLLPKGSPADGRQPYSNSIDMWAFGCIVYLLLTGEQPFMSEGHFSIPILMRFCEGEVETLLNRIKDPDALDFVRKLLVFNESDRMSASQALDHRWITNIQPTESSEINLCSTDRSETPGAYTTAPEGLFTANSPPLDTSPAKPAQVPYLRQLCLFLCIFFNALLFIYLFPKVKGRIYPILYSF